MGKLFLKFLSGAIGHQRDIYTLRPRKFSPTAYAVGIQGPALGLLGNIRKTVQGRIKPPHLFLGYYLFRVDIFRSLLSLEVVARFARSSHIPRKLPPPIISRGSGGEGLCPNPPGAVLTILGGLVPPTAGYIRGEAQIVIPEF